MLGQILKNFDFRILIRYRQDMINHRGGILIFCQIFDFGENRKIEIFNPSSNPNFGSLTLNPDFRFWQICGYLLNLVSPNLDRSRRQLFKNTKIVKFGQNLVPKFLISQILWVLGTKNNHTKSCEIYTWVGDEIYPNLAKLN